MITDVLLLALIVLTILAWWRAEIRHRRLMRLLNDFATMVSELFDVIGK